MHQPALLILYQDKNPDFLSYIRAVRRLYPHQEGLAASFAEVMAEPLFYNAAVSGQRGAPLGGPFWRQYAQGGARRVSDLRRLLLPPAPGQLGLDVPQPVPDPPPRGIVEALLQALPPAWQALVLQPDAPIPDWSAWEGHPVFFLRRPGPLSPGTAMMLQVYRMQRRGGWDHRAGGSHRRAGGPSWHGGRHSGPGRRGCLGRPPLRTDSGPRLADVCLLSRGSVAL